jgi:hypothetical protein
LPHGPRRTLKARDPELNPENVPKRKFVAGEKFWIIESHVRDNGVFLTFVSDPYSDVRYMGNLWFPFDRKQPIPPVDTFMKTMSEVIAVEPPPASAQAPSTPAPTQAPVQQAAQPLPQPIPPPKTVTVGQTREEVQAILGSPTKVAVVGAKEIEYYPDMKIILINGKVKDIQ